MPRMDSAPAEIAAALQLWARETSETNKETLNRLWRNLTIAIQEDLTPRQREMLLMRYSDGLSQIEIARRTGIDKSTVSRNLKRAYGRLRRALRYSL